ncbi:MAG: glycosyltransferase family 4 protein, partial [Candidatus Bathyarchaeia archaeon]
YYLKSRLGVDGERVVMIPNGLDHSLFDNAGSPEVFRRKWSIPEELILYVGHISARKGLTYLVRALPKVVAEHPNAKLVLVGVDRGWLQRLRAIARREGVEDSLVYTGYLPDSDLSAAYSAADLFVIPSLHEAFGLVLLEAMGFGVPVVATRAGGIPYVVEDGREGLLVRPGSSRELAEAMLRVLGDRGLAATLRSNGLRKAHSWPSWDEVADQTLAVYRSLN